VGKHRTFSIWQASLEKLILVLTATSSAGRHREMLRVYTRIWTILLPISRRTASNRAPIITAPYDGDNPFSSAIYRIYINPYNNTRSQWHSNATRVSFTFYARGTVLYWQLVATGPQYQRAVDRAAETKRRVKVKHTAKKTTNGDKNETVVWREGDSIMKSKQAQGSATPTTPGHRDRLLVFIRP